MLDCWSTHTCVSPQQVYWNHYPMQAVCNGPTITRTSLLPNQKYYFLLSASEHFRSAPARSAPTHQSRHGGRQRGWYGRRPAARWQSTSYHAVRLKDVTITGLHGGIHFPVPLSHAQNQNKNTVNSATDKFASCKAHWVPYVHSAGGQSTPIKRVWVSTCLHFAAPYVPTVFLSLLPSPRPLPDSAVPL